jgi:alkyl hydroperoxide reductase subunit AhpF
MPMIPEADQQAIREHFATALHGDVRLVVFTKAQSLIAVPGQGPDLAAEMSAQVCGLMTEIAGLSDHCTFEEHDIDSDVARDHAIDKAPAIALIGAEDYGVRYYGLPAGHDAAAFLADLVDVGNGTTQLSETTRDALAALEGDVHLQVFVTPT